MTETVLYLPTQAPRLRVPEKIWVPAEWHLVSDLDEFNEVTTYWIGKIAEEQTAPLPWLLVEKSPSAEIAAPHEFVLREFRALDIEDDYDLAEWCGRWGVPAVPEFLRAERRDPVRILEDGLRFCRGSATPSSEGSLGSGQSGSASIRWVPREADPIASQITWRIERALIHAAERARATVELRDLIFRSSGDARDLRAVQVRSARFAVGLFLAITKLFTTLPRRVTMDTASAFDTDALVEIWAPAGIPPSIFVGHPDAFLDTLVTGVRVLNAMVAGSAASTVQLANSAGEVAIGRKDQITELLATEIAVYAAEGHSPKYCDKCGSLFVRQSGRAESNQNRLTGVKYCSSNCAHAAATQAFRKRQAVARRAAGTSAAT
jgi:hypothetical protein